MKILAIETSCDETAAAVIDSQSDKLKVLSNVVASQIEIHKKYGGVVPEVAAREHVLNILPVVNEALVKAGIQKTAAAKKLSAVAVTAGPGLITSLIVGVETAKALAYAWRLPLVAVNHIEGHIYSAFINQKIKFPAVILTVSGGHTMLVLMTKHLTYKTIGDTRDDAAGEAFDKGAKLLELGYPGGPAIAAKAAQINNEQLTINNLGVATPHFIFPRPMINSDDFDFSFSGLKTSLLYQLRDDKNWKKKIPAYAHGYQQAIIDVLIAKVIKAAKKYSAKTIILSGGVSANIELRQQLTRTVEKNCPKSNLQISDLKYTTDNAAMIAAAGYFKFRAGQTIAPAKLKVDPNWQL
jgi:N6-L-threonylcarbamoyladenine synthase